MLGLPKSTELNKQLPKKALFLKFKSSRSERNLLDEQVSRMAIVAEISPHTVSVAANESIAAIYVIHLSLKSPKCDKRNIALLSKLIDQRMVFVLQHEETVQLAVHQAQRTLFSESRRVNEWHLSLSGLNLQAVWDNLVAEIGGIKLDAQTNIDEAIVAKEQLESLVKKIAALEKRVMDERQPRRKWKYAEELKNMKEGLTNG